MFGPATGVPWPETIVFGIEVSQAAHRAFGCIPVWGEIAGRSVHLKRLQRHLIGRLLARS